MARCIFSIFIPPIHAGQTRFPVPCLAPLTVFFCNTRGAMEAVRTAVTLPFALIGQAFKDATAESPADLSDLPPRFVARVGSKFGSIFDTEEALAQVILPAISRHWKTWPSFSRRLISAETRAKRVPTCGCLLSHPADSARDECRRAAPPASELARALRGHGPVDGRRDRVLPASEGGDGAKQPGFVRRFSMRRNFGTEPNSRRRCGASMTQSGRHLRRKRIGRTRCHNLPLACHFKCAGAAPLLAPCAFRESCGYSQRRTDSLTGPLQPRLVLGTPALLQLKCARRIR